MHLFSITKRIFIYFLIGTVSLFGEDDEDKKSEARDRNGRTPLHLAAHTGSSDVFDILISQYQTGQLSFQDLTALLHARDHRERTPMHLAIGSECILKAIFRLPEHLLILILQAPSQDGSTLCHAAARDGSYHILALLIEKYHDGQLSFEALRSFLQAQDNWGSTFLHAAAARHDASGLLKLLVKLHDERNLPYVLLKDLFQSKSIYGNTFLQMEAKRASLISPSLTSPVKMLMKLNPQKESHLPKKPTHAPCIS